MAHAWDNAPIYTMQIKHMASIFLSGMVVGSILSNYLIRKAYKAWYNKKLHNCAEAYHKLKQKYEQH